MWDRRRSWRVYEGLNGSGGLWPSVYTGLNALQKILLRTLRYVTLHRGNKVSYFWRHLKSASLLHNHDDDGDTYKGMAQLAGTRIILPPARLFLHPRKWPPDSNIIIATAINIFVILTQILF